MADEDMSGPKQDWERQCYAMAERTTDNAAGTVTTPTRTDVVQPENNAAAVTGFGKRAPYGKPAPAAPTQTPCPWTDIVVRRVMNSRKQEMEFFVEYSEQMRVHARRLEALCHQQQEALSALYGFARRRMATGFIPPQAALVEQALAAYAAFKKEIEK